MTRTIGTSWGFGQNVGLPTVVEPKKLSIQVIQGFQYIFLARWPRGELYGGVFGV
jgi:hypothetical protein